MKTILTIAFSAYVLLLSGCNEGNNEGEINKKPLKAVEPLHIKTEPSNVTVSMSINLKQLQEDIESKLPTQNIDMQRVNNPNCYRVDNSLLKMSIPCQYWGGLEKIGPFTLSGAGNTLTASVPLRLWATVKTKLFKTSTEANVTANISAKPMMTPNWEFRLNPEAQLRWDSHPDILILNKIPIGIQRILTDQMNSQIKKQLDLVASKIEGNQFHDRAVEIWERSFKPIRLSTDQDLWLRIGMEKVRFSGLSIDNNILKSSIGINASTEVFKGIEPPPLPFTPLPMLSTDSSPDIGFHISLPVSISYAEMVESLNKVLRKGEKWNINSDHKDVWVTINNSKIYPSGGSLAVRVDFIAVFQKILLDTTITGTVFFTGIPSVDDDTKELFFKNISLTSYTDNKSINILSNVILPSLQKLISEKLRYNYKLKHEKLLAESNDKLNHVFKNGVKSQGELSSGKLVGIYLDNESAVIQTEASGKLEISYGL